MRAYTAGCVVAAEGRVGRGLGLRLRGACQVHGQPAQAAGGVGDDLREQGVHVHMWRACMRMFVRMYAHVCAYLHVHT